MFRGKYMGRKLFSEINHTTYTISVYKEIYLRHFKNLFNHDTLSKTKQIVRLKYSVYKHNSLIRRKLGNVNLQLQENKAINLSIAAPKVSHIIIKPNEVFSFWELVGKCKAKDGYKDGLTIKNGQTSQAIGGGMCQFTNLIHWLVLHTDLDIIEHHHHDGIDLFPDFGRQIPFGTGTSIFFNYLDYRFKNNTNQTYQLIVWVEGEYLKGEILTDTQIKHKYHIVVENEYFSQENGIIYRNGNILRKKVSKLSGLVQDIKCIKVNHAKVMYDTRHLKIEMVE
jgi:vancomycin resistance protein VanW